LSLFSITWGICFSLEANPSGFNEMKGVLSRFCHGLFCFFHDRNFCFAPQQGRRPSVNAGIGLEPNRGPTSGTPHAHTHFPVLESLPVTANHQFYFWWASLTSSSGN